MQYLDKDAILGVIRALASSQGFYSRMYADILETKATNEDAYNGFMEELERQKFKEPLDVVLYFES